MEFGTRTGNPARARTHAVVVGVFEGNALTATASLLDAASDQQISRILRRGDTTGKVGECLTLRELPGLAAPRILLVGLGAAADLTPARLRRAATAAIVALRSTACKSALVALHEAEVSGDTTHRSIRHVIECFAASTYRFTEMKGKPPAPFSLEHVDFLVSGRAALNQARAAIAEGSALADGQRAAKDLANTPANVATPTYIADACKGLARDYQSVTTTVLGEKDMEKLGMGALLSVGHGSEQPSKLVIMQHRGAAKKEKPYALVGKGISFDTGGISLKQPATMYEMIYDMCGAASVYGVMHAVAAMNLPINVLGVIASAENMPSGRATRPGDIVTSMSGQTIEILNTDAEGRLVLCDALTYIAKYQPRAVIDIATLTGAIITALGQHATGLFANDDDLADALLAAGNSAQDRAWRLPLWEDYQANLMSMTADMTNVGGRGAGSITAACFLARFTRKYRWAHLDCAGTAYTPGVRKGATARPVALLTQYLIDQAQS